MKEERYHIALDDYEHGVVIRALNDTKTALMNEANPPMPWMILSSRSGMPQRKSSR